MDTPIDNFRDTMQVLLEEKMATIIVESNEVKKACKDLEEEVQTLERENANLKETVNFLTDLEDSNTSPATIGRFHY